MEMKESCGLLKVMFTRVVVCGSKVHCFFVSWFILLCLLLIGKLVRISCYFIPRSTTDAPKLCTLSGHTCIDLMGIYLQIRLHRPRKTKVVIASS